MLSCRTSLCCPNHASRLCRSSLQPSFHGEWPLNGTAAVLLNATGICKEIDVATPYRPVLSDYLLLIQYHQACPQPSRPESCALTSQTVSSSPPSPAESALGTSFAITKPQQRLSLPDSTTWQSDFLTTMRILEDLEKAGVNKFVMMAAADHAFSSLTDAPRAAYTANAGPG